DGKRSGRSQLSDHAGRLIVGRHAEPAAGATLAADAGNPVGVVAVVVLPIDFADHEGVAGAVRLIADPCAANGRAVAEGALEPGCRVESVKGAGTADTNVIGLRMLI